MTFPRATFLSAGFAGAAAPVLSAVAARADVAHTVDPDARPRLAALPAGNRRFARGAAIHPRQNVAAREHVAPRQAPFAAILDCADSRLPAEILFDQGVGDVFVCRVAGNIADPATVGSLEYAVAHFHPTLLVVLGHQNCGAVAATIDAAGSDAAPPGSIGTLIEAIRPALAALPPADRTNVAACVRANACCAAAQIRRSPIVEAARAPAHLRVVAATYDLTSGLVTLV